MSDRPTDERDADGDGDPAIRELDAKTVERIAAGEVVERPASVVKELVENALDADASRVTVAVESGGTEGIRVSDDGRGMTEDEARVAVEQHTTSKIRDIDDLEGGVVTLGFRGEALHAIGAVSRLTLTTRPRDGGRGTEVRVEGGDVEHVGPAGCPAGTTVAVEDLFYNVPARRKYLKQASTEFDHVQRVVTGYALANPAVAVTLEHDGRERFATTGSGDLREAVLAVYGKEVARAMVALRDDGADDDEESDDLPDGPLSGVWGLVSHPETNRASREYVATFVNGRWVTASAVREAVVAAYGTQLAPDRYPFAVVFLDLDPATVDVNVHPRKLEVRFADEEGAREQVRHAVERALLREGLLRSGAPRGRSAPEQTEIAPESVDSGREDDAGGASGARDGSRSSRGSREADDAVEGRESRSTRNGPPSRSRPAAGDRAGPETEGSSASGADRAASAGGGGDDQPAWADRDGRRGSRASDDGDGGAGDDGDAGAGDRIGVGRSHDSRHLHDGDDRRGRDGGRRFRGAGEQTRLSGEEPEPEFERLPSMRVLGQLHDTYVVAETDDGLVLVDQHAADERVNYERLKAAFAEDVTTQALAEPVRLELTAREASLFESYADALARLGFRASLVDGEERVAEVTTVPALLADAAGPALVRDLLTAFVDGEGARTVEQAADELLADLACYPSVTGNTSLREGSVLDLLERLDACENPYACPHGRPTVVHVGERELEDRFERDYPGHAGRRERE